MKKTWDNYLDERQLFSNAVFNERMCLVSIVAIKKLYNFETAFNSSHKDVTNTEEYSFVSVW